MPGLFRITTLLSTLLLSCGFIEVVAQQTLTLDSAMAAALRFHPSIKESNALVGEQRQMQTAAFTLDDPEFSIEVPPAEYAWRVWQQIDFPTTYISRHKLAKANTQLAEKQTAITQAELKRNVRFAYLNLQHAQARLLVVQQQDSMLAQISRATQRRYDAGDVGLLENLNAENAYRATHIELIAAQADLQNAQRQLSLLLGTSSTNPFAVDSLTPLRQDLTNITISQSPWINWAMQNTIVAKQNWKTERAELMPDFVVGYLQGTSDAPSRMELGVALPIWYWSYSARIKAARYRFDASEYRLQQIQLEQQSNQQTLASELLKQQARLNYYETTALPQAATIQDAATRAYNAGEIGYVEFRQNMQTAFTNRLNYLDAVRQHNEAVIELQTLYDL